MFLSFLVTTSLLSGADTRLATDYTAERALRISVDSSIELEVTSLEIERNGERAQSQAGGSSAKQERQIVHVDRLKAHADGRPSKVERAFEEVGATSLVRFGEEEREDRMDSGLAGVTLELERDVEDEVRVKVIDGESPAHAAALEGHRLELALDALLPDGAVAEGATWKIDTESARRALIADVMPALFAGAEEDEDADESARARQRGMRSGSAAQLLMVAEWTGTAKLVSASEEDDGVTYAVIECELEAAGEMADPEMRVGGRGRFPGAEPALPFLRTEFEAKLKGTLRFDLKEKRPHSLELEGEARVETDVEREGRDGGTVRIHSVREGAIEHKVSVTRAE